MSKLYLLSCGHVSNSISSGQPYCVICGNNQIVREVQEDEGLEGREAICRDCGKKHKSKWTLPFFQHNLNEEYDNCYDGCWGWN